MTVSQATAPVDYVDSVLAQNAVINLYNEVNQALHEILCNACAEVRARVEARGYTHREGAFEICVERVARAVE